MLETGDVNMVDSSGTRTEPLGTPKEHKVGRCRWILTNVNRLIAVGKVWLEPRVNGSSESEAGVEMTEKDRMVYGIKSCTEI